MSWYINDGLWIKNIGILNEKGVEYRCVLWNITKNDAINRLNNSILDDEGIMWIQSSVQIEHLLI